jgi:hypothetical protein
MYDSSGSHPIRTWRSVPSLEATIHLELPHESTAPHARLAACPTRGPVSKSKQGSCAELLMHWSNFQCCRHLKRPRSVVSTRHSVSASTPSFTRVSFLVGLELRKKKTRLSQNSNGDNIFWVVFVVRDSVKCSACVSVLDYVSVLDGL